MYPEPELVPLEQVLVGCTIAWVNYCNNVLQEGGFLHKGVIAAFRSIWGFVLEHFTYDT